jgi:hypothetical protein
MKCCCCPGEIVGVGTISSVYGVEGEFCETCAEWAEALIEECGTNDVGWWMGFFDICKNPEAAKESNETKD